MILRLIIYDIENDNYRNKLADTFEACGLVRIQKSVFAGRHKQHHWQRIWKLIQDLHDKWGEGNDKIYSMIISNQMFKTMKSIGIAPPIEEITEDQITMWI